MEENQLLKLIYPQVCPTLSPHLSFDSGYWSPSSFTVSKGYAFGVSSDNQLLPYDFSTEKLDKNVYLDQRFQVLDSYEDDLYGVIYNPDLEENQLLKIDISTGLSNFISSFKFDSGYWSPSSFTVSEDYAFGVSSDNQLIFVDLLNYDSGPEPSKDILFSSRLLEADGITEASGLELASWDPSMTCLENMSWRFLQRPWGKEHLMVDFNLDFNNSIFKAVDGKDIEIDDSLPLANSALIDNEDGTVRIAAGVRMSLELGTGIKVKQMFYAFWST